MRRVRLKGEVMKPWSRIITFLLSAVALGIVYWLFKADLPVDESSASVFIFSTLLTLSFAVMLLEHWFTKPTDVVATTISLLLAMAPSRPSLEKLGIWFDIFFWYLIFVLVLALAALALLDSESSADSKRNTWSNFLKKVSTKFGSARLLYFGFFCLTVLFYVDSQKPVFVALFLYAGLVIILDPKTLGGWLSKKQSAQSLEIGEIIGVQSRHTYLARLLTGRPKIKRYDFVEFADEADAGKSRKGIIVDNWVLNSQQWIKVVSGADINKSLGTAAIGGNLKPNTVYKIETEDTSDILGRFVGTLSDSSNILSIRFDYGMKIPISEGTLLEVEVTNQKVLYQVTQGVAETKVLENKNEAGLIIGYAAQIGTWNPNTLTFDRFGWVPEINTPVYLASKIEVVPPPEGELLLGHIPDTNYPVFMDKQMAINCHMAILGVTGTGKSVFARELLRQLSAGGMKFICVDFTGEYNSKLAHLNPVDIVPNAAAADLFLTVDALIAERAKFPNHQNIQQIAAWELELTNGFRNAITAFLAGANNVAIFELPDVANSTSILSYTRWFFKILFQLAKEGGHVADQLCVVLEEAHTVIPEWSFVSSEDKGSQALLNQIAQIALQGRKYGVGFMVIAQRTANVSKTVLTQCNTIVAFQQFDKTSGDFLANYMGAGMIDALQNLKPRQAIAVGKAFRSGLPVIFRVPDIAEPEPPAPAPAPQAEAIIEH
jgi:uncharacterized protein